eukprot:31387-Pelagococcus_subviridis.AAC.13
MPPPLPATDGPLSSSLRSARRRVPRARERARLRRRASRGVREIVASRFRDDPRGRGGGRAVRRLQAQLRHLERRRGQVRGVEDPDRRRRLRRGGADLEPPPLQDRLRRGVRRGPAHHPQPPRLRALQGSARGRRHGARGLALPAPPPGQHRDRPAEDLQGRGVGAAHRRQAARARDGALGSPRDERPNLRRAGQGAERGGEQDVQGVRRR